MLREGREARELAERFGPHWSGDIAGFKSVLKSLENMGEEIHAGKVDDGFRAAHPPTNWAAIEAFRHISVHDYEKVRREIIRPGEVRECPSTAAARARVPPGLLAVVIADSALAWGAAMGRTGPHWPKGARPLQ
jgi:hypothetical protein